MVPAVTACAVDVKVIVRPEEDPPLEEEALPEGTTEVELL